MRDTPAVLLGVPEKKNDVLLVTSILHSINVYCKQSSATG